jgi:cytoskeletal protein CcmA (bactofilin family)
MSLFGGRKNPKPPIPDDLPDVSSSLPRQPMGFETVIGSNTTLYGELRSQSDVRIDGTFEGTLQIEGNVLVGETGKVNADIHARNVSVAGAVRGDIGGRKVQLLRTARVWGNISASAITTEEGAFIDGKLTMVQHDASTHSMEVPSLPAPEAQIDPPLEVLEGETVGEEK